MNRFDIEVMKFMLLLLWFNYNTLEYWKARHNPIILEV